MKSLLTAFIVLLSAAAIAQEASKSKLTQEIGLSASSLEDFGLVYRIGKSVKSFWRVSLLSLNSTTETAETMTSDITSNSRSYTVALGKEFRKELSSGLHLRYGADIFYSYGFNRTQQTATTQDPQQFFETMNKSQTTGVGLNLVFGINYALRENLLLGVEIQPYWERVIDKVDGTVENFMVYEETSKTAEIFDIGFMNNSALVTITFVW